MRVLVASSSARQMLDVRMDLLRAMLAAGHEVHAAAKNDAGERVDEFARAGVAYHELAVENQRLNVLADIASQRSFDDIMLAVRPEAVLLNHAKVVVSGVRAAKQWGVPHVYALISGLGSAIRGTGVRTALTRAVLVRAYRWALPRCERVFFHNRDDAAYCIERALVKPHAAVVVNGSGVDVREFEPRPLPDRSTFLFLGRLLREKGVHEYLEAAAGLKRAMPDVRCIVAGFSDANPSALSSAYVADFARSHDIEFRGQQRDVRDLIGSCSVFVLPSYHEGLPRGVLEAMSMGRAIITTDVPGCRETVDPGVNGFLVPPRDPAALERAMERCARNPRGVREMGAASRRAAVERFDVRDVNRIMLETMGLIAPSEARSAVVRSMPERVPAPARLALKPSDSTRGR